MNSSELAIDFINGKVFFGFELIAEPGLKITQINIQAERHKWKFYEVRKIKSARLDSILSWGGYNAESIILAFKNEKIYSLKIPFQPTPDQIYTVLGHPIVKIIEENLLSENLISESKSEKQYKTDFGFISIQYDIRMLSVVLTIYYHPH